MIYHGMVDGEVDTMIVHPDDNKLIWTNPYLHLFINDDKAISITVSFNDGSTHELKKTGGEYEKADDLHRTDLQQRSSDTSPSSIESDLGRKASDR